MIFFLFLKIPAVCHNFPIRSGTGCPFPYQSIGGDALFIHRTSEVNPVLVTFLASFLVVTVFFTKRNRHISRRVKI